MHHNITHALADCKAAYTLLNQEMEHLDCEDIEEAFANNGYLQMRPVSCKHSTTNHLENGAPQWVYDCEWPDEGGFNPETGTTTTEITKVYVFIENSVVKADV